MNIGLIGRAVGTIKSSNRLVTFGPDAVTTSSYNHGTVLYESNNYAPPAGQTRGFRAVVPLTGAIPEVQQSQSRNR